MKIAVYSDIHDNQHNMRLAFAKFKELGIERALFLGDANSPYIVREMIAFGLPTHFIWGNNEGDKVAITKFIMSSNGLFTLSTRRDDIYEIDGKKIALLHHEDFATSLGKSGDFNAVFYAHTHEKDLQKFGECIVANPGEISAHATGKCTFILWETTDNSVEFVEIENPINVNQ